MGDSQHDVREAWGQDPSPGITCASSLPRPFRGSPEDQNQFDLMVEMNEIFVKVISNHICISFEECQWCWKHHHHHVFISLALVIKRLNFVALLFCACAHCLKLFTCKSHMDSTWNGSSSLWFSACHPFPFSRSMSRLYACSRLRGPPAGNYRYLFFINEVKPQLSRPFLELRGKLFHWWLGSFNRCLFHFKWVNICIHICWLGYLRCQRCQQTCI